ncbi:unnamed protein product [Lampetra planeri]
MGCACTSGCGGRCWVLGGDRALNKVSMTVLPVSQILLPLRLRRPLKLDSPETGILLSPSNYFSRMDGLVGALTAMSECQDPFLQVLNSGPLPIVVLAGTILAHAILVPPPDDARPAGGVVAGMMHAGKTDVSWIDALCNENASLSPKEHQQTH